MPEAAWFAHVESPENARTAWDIVVRPLPDACLPLCARYLIATAIDPLSLISLSTWKTVLAGFTTAARPSAGFASGYRARGACVAAAELARLRSVAKQSQMLSPRSIWIDTPVAAKACVAVSLAASGKFRGSQDQDAGRRWSQSSIHEAN
ncbi:hypothetical protein C4K10_3372 [Pseudomonas chlororaphis subsp. aureofaciens]|nr:hypothetical protein C4K10_3372 [Pseudomonas chlororaphis subsp. aureofaciens]